MDHPDFADFISSLNRKYDQAYEAYLIGDFETECMLTDQGVGMKEAFLLIFGDKYKIVVRESQGNYNHEIVNQGSI